MRTPTGWVQHVTSDEGVPFWLLTFLKATAKQVWKVPVAMQLCEAVAFELNANSVANFTN